MKQSAKVHNENFISAMPVIDAKEPLYTRLTVAQFTKIFHEMIPLQKTVSFYIGKCQQYVCEWLASL